MKFSKKTWVAMGSAILFSSCLNPASDLQQNLEVEPTYVWLSRNVFEPKCVKCHSGPDSPHGVDLSSYESIKQSTVFPPLVVPGVPEESSLFDSTNSGRMPKRAGKLPQKEIDAIREWIKRGAKRNPDDLDPSPSPSPEPCEEDNPEDCES